MPRSESTLTRQELAIMKVIWQLETATVRDVYEAMRRRRRIAYTTVMTMMKILSAKGFLVKRLEGRAYRYRPARPKQAVVGSMVREFVDRVFDGAARPLLLHLVRQERLTDAERAELARLIEETK